MATYFEDKEFSDRMMPLVETVLHRLDKRQLFGSLLNDGYRINYSTDEQDRQHATDLVLQARNLNISVRVRRADALPYWPQLTLSEGKEYRLITREDYVDAYFVGVASFDETRLTHWMVVNLHRFRECLRHNLGPLSPRSFRNRNGQRFLGFTMLPEVPGLLIQSSHHQHNGCARNLGNPLPTVGV